MIKGLLSLLLMLIVSSVTAQKVTYILFRHAEKDTTKLGSTQMNANPPLSSIGETRALHLVEVLKGYTVTEIYSTNFIRTQNTVKPLSAKLNIDITLYNPKQLDSLAVVLRQKKEGVIVVVGHNTTTPALANLLMQKKQYEALREDEYNKIFIVENNNGIWVSKVIGYAASN